MLAAHDSLTGSKAPRLTRHTAESLLAGAERGWTTMTANRASVRAVLRGLRAHAETSLIAPEHAGDAADGPATRPQAALWVVDPRSLAEGMRADFLDQLGSSETAGLRDFERLSVGCT